MLPQLRRHLLENWQDLPLSGPRPRDLAFLVQATGVGKLCCYVFPDDAAEPRWVVKMRRSPSENDLLGREYALIEHLRRHGSDYVRATIPGALTTVHVAGHLVVIEPYLRGRAMDGLMASAKHQTWTHLPEYLDMAIGWLLRGQCETPLQRGRLTEQQIYHYFLEPIAYLRSAARLTEEELAYLDSLVGRIGQLARYPLPLPFIHGDFQPGNVLVHGRSLQIIDWEFGLPTALPLMDLFGFLLRAYARCHGLEEMDGCLEDYLLDFEAVFFGGDPFARHTVAYVDRAVKALDIDPAWVPVLFAMFVVTEANRYDAWLRRRAERGYLYLLHSKISEMSGSYSEQLARQKNVWLLGYLAQHESRLAFTRSVAAFEDPWTSAVEGVAVGASCPGPAATTATGCRVHQ